MNERVFNIGAYVLILIVGIGIGCVWGNVPYLTLDPQVSLTDLVSLAVTVFIAVKVSKILQSNLGITTYLINELGELIEQIKAVHKVIADAYSAGSFSASDRDALMFAFHNVELKLGSLETQLSAAFPKKSVKITQSLKNACFDYKNHLTGGEIMLSSFDRVSDNCYRDCCTQHSKIETVIKTTLQKVHRL